MNGLKLLVVDDDADFAKLIGNIARGLGADVIATHSPAMFKKIYTDDIDIVVIDVFMPDIDGVELLRFLADRNSRSGVIIVSGFDAQVLRTVHKIAIEEKLHVLGVFQKPFHIVEFENALVSFNRTAPKVKPLDDKQPSIRDLIDAVKNNELYLNYQPQIGMANGTVVGFEALLRWAHPKKGYIPPSVFIPMAEDIGLIDQLTYFSAEEAIKQHSVLSRAGLNVRLSVNLSPKVLDDLEMPERIERLTNRYGVDKSQLVFEVTETTLMSDFSAYMEILARMRMKGFQLSIDDFGIGYSSLFNLIQVPFTELKIDQTFVKTLDVDNQCRQVAETIIVLAQKLNMRVVAEGIETEKIWTDLQQMGCQTGQGYWMGRPMAADQIKPWLNDWQKASSR